MKKIVLIVFVVLSLVAKDYEITLYNDIFHSLFNKDILIVKVSTNNEKINNLSMLKKINNCEKADILIGYFKHLPKKCQDKPIFALSYRGFKKQKNVIGAFYWRKGRPQLIFKEDILNKFDIKLPNRYNKFIR